MKVQSISFTGPGGEYAAEQAEIERRRRMAEMLQMQSDEPLQTNRMAGGMVVPISPWEGVAKVAKGAMGGIQNARAEQMAKALRDRQQGDTQADISAYVQALRGRPASPGGLTEDASGNVTMADPMQAKPGGVSPELISQLRTPQMQGMALQQLMEQMKPRDPMGMIGKIDPKDYTPESFQAFTATGNPALLRARTKMEVTPTGTAYDPYALQPNQPVFTKPEDKWSDPYEMGGAQVQRNERTGEIRTAVGRAPVTNVQTRVDVPPPSKVFENENKLRDDYSAATKPFVGIRDAYNTVQAALSGPITATSTLAGATKFMKMIDPESVVRESELNMALKATGMLDRFMNLHNTVLKGQVLTPKQAEEIKSIAETLYTTAAAQQAKTDEYFGGLAKSYGLNPERVIRKQDAVMRDRRGEARKDKTVVVDY